MKKLKSFASDNNSPVHPKVMEALCNVNTGDVISYGDDDYTRSAIKKFKELLGEDIEVYFVYNGTGANITGIKSAANSFNSIICVETAHINVDECGAPENFCGSKLITVSSVDGKLKVEHIRKQLHALGDEHHSQPGLISITQSTELGTVYTIEELKELCGFAHKNGLLVHMDGARIANAAAFLNTSIKSMTKDAGVDVLSFGGTKNGMMFGEAVVFFNKSLAKNYKFIRKQGMQLASKMRYISAQFEAMLTDDLYLKNARQSNLMAKKLEEELLKIPEIKITQKVEANAIFAIVPKSAIEKLLKQYFFYMWDEENSEVRWVTAFDTTIEDIQGFIYALKEALK